LKEFFASLHKLDAKVEAEVSASQAVLNASRILHRALTWLNFPFVNCIANHVIKK
jgi:hypothetical protein